MSEIGDRVKRRIEERILERHNIVLFEDDAEYILSIPELNRGLELYEKEQRNAKNTR